MLKNSPQSTMAMY